MAATAWRIGINSSTLIGGGILLGISIAAPIGPVNIEIIRRGLRGGFLPALLVGCGSTAADLVYVALVYVGVAPLIEQPLFRVLLDLAASLVLGQLARGSFREAFGRTRTLEGEGSEVPPLRRGALAAGFFITLSNPMTVVFYLSLFGGAVATLHEASRSSHLLLVASVVVGCLLWSFLMALILGWGRGKIGSRITRGISAVAGLALIFFAVRFLLEGVREAVRGLE